MVVAESPGAPSAAPGTPAASRTVEVALLAVVGAAAGCSLLLVPPPARTLAAHAVLLAALTLNTAVVLADGSRRRRRADAERSGSPVPSAAPLLRRPAVRRAYAVLLGVSVTSLWVLAGAGVAGIAAPAVVGAATLAFVLLVGLSRRRRLAAARAAHPGAAVVLVGLAGLTTMRLAQWAKATGTPLPAVLGSGWALVADAEGVRLTSATRTPRPLPLWRWDEVELRRGAHPDYPDDPGACALVVTLLGPEPPQRSRALPLGRRRHEMTLTVLDGTWPATPEVVDAALAGLSARRPPRAGRPDDDPGAS